MPNTRRIHWVLAIVGILGVAIVIVVCGSSANARRVARLEEASVISIELFTARKKVLYQFWNECTNFKQGSGHWPSAIEDIKFENNNLTAVLLNGNKAYRIAKVEIDWTSLTNSQQCVFARVIPSTGDDDLSREAGKGIYVPVLLNDGQVIPSSSLPLAGEGRGSP